jgi:hypothetical protein
VRPWLRRGAAAASLAGERSDLWPAGTLAWSATIGWLPLLLAVAPPDVDDVAGLAVSLYSSGSYPANVVALAVAVVSGFMLLALLASAAEVAIIRNVVMAPPGATAAAARHGPTPGAATLAGLAVVLLAAAPVLVAAAWLAVGVAAEGPAIYSAPGSESTIVQRLAAAVLPQLVVLALVLLLGQAIGGSLLRRAIGSASDRLGTALRDGMRELGRSPLRRLGVAAAGLLKDVLLLAGSWALLQLLWRPIGEALGPGLLTSPQVLLLLVGFVAIWLILLLVGGVLHAFISAWWLLEEADGR